MDNKAARRKLNRIRREEREKQEYRDWIRSKDHWKGMTDKEIDDMAIANSNMVYDVLPEEEYKERRKKILDFYNEFIPTYGMNEEHKRGSKFNLSYETNSTFDELSEDDAEQRIHLEFIKDFEDYFNIYRPEDDRRGKRESTNG